MTVTAPIPRASDRPTVLVVDDSAMVRRQVGTALAAAGFEVVEAVDGEDAHAKLVAMALPQLVVCDVNMPRMNGIELLERIRAEDRFAALPFIILTTEAQPELIRRANQLGAKGWLVKPFKSEILISAVRKLVSSARPGNSNG